MVNGFEYDSETTVLNFKTTMIGPEGVLLSNVFKRKKGVGVKLLVDGITLVNSDIVTKEKILSYEESKTFLSTLAKIEDSRRKNGLVGEEYVFDNIEKFVGGEPIEKRHISKTYPQSPYDIECVINGKTIYIEVKSKKDSKKTFYMSKGEKNLWINMKRITF